MSAVVPQEPSLPLACASGNDALTYGSTGYEQRLALIRERLSAARSVFSIAHPFADGDALGSQMALHHYCLATGKRSFCLNFDPIPDQISWLASGTALVSDLPAGETFDLGFLMETTEASRMGDRIRFFERAGTCIHLDHHVGVPGLGQINFLAPDASSTCEILYNLLEPLWQPISREGLTALYVGIMTDTGNFRYGNTTPRAHHIAASMLETGLLDVASVFERVYEAASLARVTIHGDVMSRVQASMGGKIVHSWLTVDDFVRHGAGETDADGCVRHLCTILGMEVALMFKEQADTTVKVSFRSRGAIDVRAISQVFRGGGHRQAAGAVIPGTLPTVMSDVLAVTERAIQESER